MNLRKKLIRLAHENPELRRDLIPLLKEGMGGGRHAGRARMLPRPWRAPLDDYLRKNRGRGMTVDEIARKLGLSLSDVEQVLEAGRNREQVARQLGVPLDKVLDLLSR